MEDTYQSRGYLLSNFRLFHLSDEHGTQVDFHYHDFCKLVFLRNGSGSYTVEGQRYRLKSGDIVFIDHHAIHRPEFQPGALYERIIIYISPDFPQRYSLPECDLREVFSGTDGHVLRPDERVSQRLLRLVLELEGELSRRDYGAEVIGSALLVRILVELLRERRNGAAQCPKPLAPENARIRDILRYIDAHLTEDITIDDLAERFYISKYHMMRLIHQEVGQSIHAYLSDRRLLHARELIRSGKNATESCFRSGFRSYSSFTRAWNKRFGGTPTGRGAPADELYE